MDDSTSNSELWDFMLKLYAEPGIPDALLGMQSEHAIDVPFYLAVLHAVITQHHVSTKAISALYAEVQEWREKVVLPLRAVRTTLKMHPWSTRFENASSFRDTIKSAELNAEKIEVMAMEKLMPAYLQRAIGEKPDIFAISAALLNFFGHSTLAQLPPEAEFVANMIVRNHQK
ncbi:TIGR02444 family protein [Brucella gallinifaecis]|uniref:TIGR02444 family protein n=1 Tax=Brucella gallinifaecis TaxID=215590 RepID=UPI002360D15F|nr:TIGR02444 family protein [Brucella gallinifaecis]